MSVFDRGINVSVCEKTLRKCVISHDQYKALSILVELAVHGVKYVKENDIKLRSRRFMNSLVGEEE